MHSFPSGGKSILSASARGARRAINATIAGAKNAVPRVAEREVTIAESRRAEGRLGRSPEEGVRVGDAEERAPVC